MTNSHTDTVLRTSVGHVAILTLNRPPRNTMSPDIMARFVEALDEVRNDTFARCLIITGSGKHFCAGAELGTGVPGTPQALGGPAGTAERLRGVYQPFLAMLDMDIPTIAAVNGAAVGGGLGLACACDFRVMTPSTRLLAPFARLGIHPGMALTHTLPMLIGLPRAMEILVAGEEIRGPLALQWGLANRCVDESELMTESLALAGRLAEGSPAVVRWTKRAIHRAVELDARTAADVEALAQALTFASEDYEEGLQAFLDKRTPRFKGC
jgi:enoyl-CoA hydratase/carnithine racemase